MEWNSICTPVLTYGLDDLNINATNMKQLETTQENVIEQCLGISKRCRKITDAELENISPVKRILRRSYYEHEFVIECERRNKRGCPAVKWGNLH